MDESGLESAVKGIAQGIAGRFKEIAGELTEDDDLEQDGIVQQLDSRMRRSGEDPALLLRSEQPGDATDVVDVAETFKLAAPEGFGVDVEGALESVTEPLGHPTPCRRADQAPVDEGERGHHLHRAE